MYFQFNYSTPLSHAEGFLKAVYPLEKKSEKKKNRQLISAEDMHDKCITWQTANENKKEDWFFAQLLEDHSRQNLSCLNTGGKRMHCLAE